MLFYSHLPAVLSSMHRAEEAFACDCSSGILQAGILFCSFWQPLFLGPGGCGGGHCWLQMHRAKEQDVAVEERVIKAAGPGVEALT